MIYTVGLAKQYDAYIESDPYPMKAGQTGCYVGGSVWQTKHEAELHCPEHFKVYGVIADWEKDTEPSEQGKWHNLLRDALLVQLE